MRLGFLLWCLCTSCALIYAQEKKVSAVFNASPIVKISDDGIDISFGYTLKARNEKVSFSYSIYDSNGKKVSDKEKYLNSICDEESFYDSYRFENRKFSGYKPPFYINAKIWWNYEEHKYHLLAMIDESPFSLNVSSSNASTSSSSNTNPKYKASDPNLVDNSEKIANAHQLIDNLESQKRNCSSCHGTGSIPTICTMCRGTGTIKMGYYTPQFFKCNYCGGTGKQKKQCMACYQTNMQISFAQNLLKTLQETHGMTKETLNTYIKIKSMEHKQNMEFQRAINEIAEPYLNGTRKSNSSNSSTSSSSKTCTYCGGTGVSKIGILGSGGTGVAYTNAAGEDCPYCDEYDYKFHHHDRCTCKLK